MERESSSAREDLRIPDNRPFGSVYLTNLPVKAAKPAMNLASVHCDSVFPERPRIIAECHLNRKGALSRCAAVTPLRGTTMAGLVMRTDSISTRTSNARLETEVRYCSKLQL